MSDNGSKTGRLYVVATPIGNLEEMSPRAIRTLQEVDLVVAEDTRHSKTLFQHFGIATELKSLNEQNEVRRIPGLLKLLGSDQDIALISDAGTPLVSDPGFALVRAAREAGFEVSPIAGPSALIAALSVAGLPSDRFVFEGFLPAKRAARVARLQELSMESRTLVFYESVHRIEASLEDMAKVMGEDRAAVVARELTKKFETVVSAPLQEQIRKLKGSPETRRGEYVVLLHGTEVGAGERDELKAEAVLKILMDELPASQAARLAARITGVPKKQLYQIAIG